MIGRILSYNSTTRDGDIIGSDGKIYWVRGFLPIRFGEPVNRLVVFDPAEPGDERFTTKAHTQDGALNIVKASSWDLLKALLHNERAPEPMTVKWTNPIRKELL